ncbi:hypothetical protein GCM10010116_54610 [Microbispora rosea subsp. aerata]|nr:hypothetical protein [Microbispora rosea]GGO27241.1 hypothetical protein GCM10010116_54610 [Microbispora rosea subsp. aerata]GIH57613.1 hypothetical protein Mro02_45270 [Microbispora rosea subsp. aerata]GLJ86791.1 hypothetical protein GCM10017588_55320 [Microbispora rosea subsp. aerata]
MSESAPRVRDLVQRAASDPAFAEQLLSEPESVASEYNLGPDQIDQIKELAGAGLLQPAVQAHVAPVDVGSGSYY